MIKQLLVAGALGAMAPQAIAAEQIVLTPGQEITIEVDADGGVRAGPVLAARDASPLEQTALAGAVGTPIPEGAKTVAPRTVFGPSDGPEQDIPPEHIRLTFRHVAGRSPADSTLLIENGYGRQVRYKAAITRSGRTAPTDVCTVSPKLIGLEHWPYPIDRVAVSELSLESPPAEGGVTCE